MPPSTRATTTEGDADASAEQAEPHSIQSGLNFDTAVQAAVARALEQQTAGMVAQVIAAMDSRIPQSTAPVSETSAAQMQQVAFDGNAATNLQHAANNGNGTSQSTFGEDESTLHELSNEPSRARNGSCGDELQLGAGAEQHPGIL